LEAASPSPWQLGSYRQIYVPDSQKKASLLADMSAPVSKAVVDGLAMPPSSQMVWRVSLREHTCWTSGVTKFGFSVSKDWLDEAVSQHLLVTKTTKPKEIVETIKIHFAEIIM
jgi:hypothetical protein